MIIKRVRSLLEGYDFNIKTDDISATDEKSFAQAYAQKIANKNRNKDLSPVIADSILKFGKIDRITSKENGKDKITYNVNIDRNPFLKVLSNIEGDPNQYRDIGGKLHYLYGKILKNKSYQSPLLGTQISPWLTKSSLYKDRDLDGFKYTLTALEFVYDRTKIIDHFKNPEVVKPEELFYKDHEVKTPREIYKIIDSWEEADNKGVDNKEDSKGKRSIFEYFKVVIPKDEKNNFIYEFEKNEDIISIQQKISRFVKDFDYKDFKKVEKNEEWLKNFVNDDKQFEKFIPENNFKKEYAETVAKAIYNSATGKK